jgi:hypothetical protein
MTVRTTSLLVAVVLSTAALPGCVTSPNWGDSPSSRRDAIDFTGMASRANAPLRVQAWNYTTSTFDTVRSFTGSATRLATSPDLYGWSTNTVVLPDRYWSPGGCESSGMANLRVLEVNTDGTTSELATFTEAGMDCVNDHLGEGDHPVVAGNACRYPEPRIVLTTPVQCPFPNLADITGPQLSIRLADPTRVWQATSGGSELTAAGITRTTTMTATAPAPRRREHRRRGPVDRRSQPAVPERRWQHAVVAPRLRRASHPGRGRGDPQPDQPRRHPRDQHQRPDQRVSLGHHLRAPRRRDPRRRPQRRRGLRGLPGDPLHRPVSELGEGGGRLTAGRDPVTVRP